MTIFSMVCGVNGTFTLDLRHNLKNECLVTKNLLMNVIKMNEHSNVATFVHALLCTHA